MGWWGIMGNALRKFKSKVKPIRNEQPEVPVGPTGSDDSVEFRVRDIIDYGSSGHIPISPSKNGEQVAELCNFLEKTRKKHKRGTTGTLLTLPELTRDMYEAEKNRCSDHCQKVPEMEDLEVVYTCAL